MEYRFLKRYTFGMKFKPFSPRAMPDDRREISLPRYILLASILSGVAVATVVGFGHGMHLWGQTKWHKLLFILGAAFLCIFFGFLLTLSRTRNIRDATSASLLAAAGTTLAFALSLLFLVLLKLGFRLLGVNIF
jgi:hypothetical protein